MIFRLIGGVLAITLVFIADEQLQAQVKWQRTEPEIVMAPQVFHTTKSIGLPTAETLRKGDFEFEISHRFLPATKEGYSALYGFDGPAKMRLAIGYAIFDNWVITLGRSNIDANTDFWVKYRPLQLTNSFMPLMVAFQIGAAWNPIETFRLNDQGDLIIRPKKHDRHLQYYGHVIIDFKPFSRLGIGLVPSFLYNRDIVAEDIQNTYTLGTHYQFNLTRLWSIIGEWSFIVSGKDGWHNPGAMGLELETGAHIFEMFLTNQVRINQAQYLSGSEFPFDGDNLRIGFLITRII